LDAASIMPDRNEHPHSFEDAEIAMVQVLDGEISIPDLVRTATVEVIPLKGAAEKVAAVPVDTTVTITCSPRFGLARTLEHVAAARATGHRVVPHLAARMVADERRLRDFVRRVTDLGVDDLYVIGGDAEEPVGGFTEASQVLQALRDFDHGLKRIGVGCYPEGHPSIPDDALFDALERKQPYADYMVSQLCFDAAALVGWLRTMRDAGIQLPLRIGLAAPLQTRKLIELSLKIGVGRSVRYLSKQNGFVGNLLLGRAYEPAQLLAEVGNKGSFLNLGVEGLHLFSFNQIEATVDWQARITGAIGVS
jgi:methylenetetrahydrofolate reductase (NADPH)